MPFMYPVVLVIAGALAYATSVGGAFLLDDHSNIVLEESIRSFDGVWQAARPVVSLSLRINYALGAERVEGYHLFNIGVHLLAGLTLYGWLRRTLRRFPQGHPAQASATGLSFVVALLWLVHPLQTQAVSYVIQRSECLMALFYLLTVYCIVRGADSGRWWYAAALPACALGMMSKEVMITAPVLAILYDRVFIAPSWRQLVRQRGILHLALMATWVLLRGPLSWAVMPSSPQTTAGFGLQGVTPWEYAATQPGVILHYLRLVFWPHPLCLDYGWPVARTAAAILVPGALVMALLLVTLWGLWRKPWLGFWGAWFFVILAPTSSIMPIADIAFEHRMYLPLAAVLVLCVLAVHAALLGLGRQGWSEGTLRAARGWSVAIVALVCMALTTMRNADYQSELAMWENVVAQHPENARAHYNLARALCGTNDIDRADREFRVAIGLKPDDWRPHFGYGHMLFVHHRLMEAAAEFQTVLRLNPGMRQAEYLLEQIRVMSSPS